MFHKLFTYLFQKSITRFGNRIKISQPTFLAESLVKKTHRRNIINYFPINSVFRFALYKYRESKETARYLNSNKNCLGPWILPSGDEDDLQLPRERDAAIIQDGKRRRVVAPHVRQLVNINRFVLGVSPRGCLLLSLIGESSSKLAPSPSPFPRPTSIQRCRRTNRWYWFTCLDRYVKYVCCTIQWRSWLLSTKNSKFFYANWNCANPI